MALDQFEFGVFGAVHHRRTDSEGEIDVVALRQGEGHLDVTLLGATHRGHLTPAIVPTMPQQADVRATRAVSALEQQRNGLAQFQIQAFLYDFATGDVDRVLEEAANGFADTRQPFVFPEALFGALHGATQSFHSMCCARFHAPQHGHWPFGKQGAQSPEQTPTGRHQKFHREYQRFFPAAEFVRYREWRCLT